MRIIDDAFHQPHRPLEPKLGHLVYIAPEAVVLGDVRLGDNASVWPGAVLRGDIAPVIVGRFTNIQDLSLCHVANDKPCVIGDEVTVGHRAILHACKVEDGCLIGMGAIVLDDCVIGAESLVAAGSLVTPGTIIPPGSLVMGAPAKVKRALTPEERAQGRALAHKYFDLSRAHVAGLYRRADTTTERTI